MYNSSKLNNIMCPYYLLLVCVCVCVCVCVYTHTVFVLMRRSGGCTYIHVCIVSLCTSLTNLGSSHERMAKETERFTSFKQQCLAEKKKEPKGDGVLIFDEVKVISRLMWNSKSQKIGLAMSPDDMSSLHDAYQLVDETSASKQTSYILQFLWRDLTSPLTSWVPTSLVAASLKANSLYPVFYRAFESFTSMAFIHVL